MGAGAFTFFILLLGCEAGGYSYFSAFANNELRPYFVARGMEMDLNEANRVFVYLLISAIVLWFKIVSMIFDLFSGRSSLGFEAYQPSFRSILECAMAVTIIVLACLTAQNVWRWWLYFDAYSLDHLAAHCHGLAGMVTACMIHMALVLIVITLLVTC
ncbi:hypothetical protein GGS26DRAFT_575871 [Hypomontagnella submonticulosa]|nr:hypothetical protein GGS26DRAFT_575871 [Hypomontagnella submonticulosa]